MMLNKKHALALAAASVIALGATSSLSAAPVLTNTASVKAANDDGVTQVRYKHHRTHIRGQQLWTQQQSQNWGPFDAPAAAVAGAGAIAGGALATTGAIVGGTTAAVTGYPYGYGSYAYAPNAYGAYAYAPGPYSPGGFARDIGHQYYNGAAAPASQDNCAVDGGYGRLDYSAAC